MQEIPVGISGMAAYVPPYRVDLADWCRWYGADWGKTQRVIGSGFRMRGPDRSVYTLAATAVLRLLEQYRIDPERVSYLALGTESSTDNSAGAVIVRGMIDEVLRKRGEALLSRHCEVPEFKHACLGGIYALKGAARSLAFAEPRDCAIVVCADVAEYELGTSGEPTQGAGAVAMLVEREPTIATLDLTGIGLAADYRGPDFRKPMQRLLDQKPNATGHIRDFPIFNGKYSTACYIDEVLCALDHLFRRRGIDRPGAHFRQLAAVFLHRPYRRMAETGWALAYIAALAGGAPEERSELAELAERAEVPFEDLVDELTRRHRLYEALRDEGLNGDLHPLAMRTVRAFRGMEAYRERVASKLALGSKHMAELGNLYTAALPAWLAAGLEEAAERGLELAGSEILLIGYGSGDAAAAVPITIQPDWRKAAEGIGLARAMAKPVDLSREQYEALHEHGRAPQLEPRAKGEFLVEGVGDASDCGLDERWIEYYRYAE